MSDEKSPDWPDECPDTKDQGESSCPVGLMKDSVGDRCNGKAHHEEEQDQQDPLDQGEAVELVSIRIE